MSWKINLKIGLYVKTFNGLNTGHVVSTHQKTLVGFNVRTNTQTDVINDCVVQFTGRLM